MLLCELVSCFVEDPSVKSYLFNSFFKKKEKDASFVNSIVLHNFVPVHYWILLGIDGNCGSLF